MKRKCFVAAPIGKKGSKTRKRTDGMIENIIRPLVEEKLGFDVYISHEIPNPGSITLQIFKHIEKDDLVIIDLSELNANVIYEMAARQALGKPYVLIAEDKGKHTKLPFDFSQDRTIFYKNSFDGVSELKNNLEKSILSALDEPDTNNPIYQSAANVIVNGSTTNVPDSSIYRLIMAKLDAVELNTINLYTNKALMDFHGISPYFGAIIHLDVNNTPDHIISKIISKITVYFIRNGVQVAVVIDKKNNYLKIVNGNSEKIMKVVVPTIEVEFGLEKLSYEYYEE